MLIRLKAMVDPVPITSSPELATIPATRWSAPPRGLNERAWIIKPFRPHSSWILWAHLGWSKKDQTQA
jgi:hypothetical protein